MQSFVKSDVLLRQWPAVGERRELTVRGTGCKPIDFAFNAKVQLDTFHLEVIIAAERHRRCSLNNRLDQNNGTNIPNNQTPVTNLRSLMHKRRMRST